MSPAWNRGFVTQLWWGVALLLALFAAVVGQSILTTWRQHEEQTVVETYSVARVLESDLGGLFDKVKLALHTVALEQERLLSAPRRDEAAASHYVASILDNLPDVMTIRITDAEGRIVLDGKADPAGASALGGAPYLARLRDECLTGIVISAPHREGPQGPWVIDIARRIEYADGRFAGVAIAVVSTQRLETMLAAADIGSNGAVALRGEGLSFVARFPPLGDRTDAGKAPGALRDIVERGEISGTYSARSLVDGVERLYSYRRIAGYPLHVTVGRATSDYMGHWQRDMGVVGVLAAVLFGVMIVAAVIVHRAWGRQGEVARLLEMQAHTDPLTGVANRRRFFEMAESEMARARRYDAPLSLLMLDIDFFKAVNDSHGHRAGDQVLQQLARTCLEVLRNVDVVGRVGGEEFAILLPETNMESAAEVAERLRVAIENDQVAREHGKPLRITVSIGVALLEASANLDTLMSQADTALYDAKHRGRNRVCAFEPGA